MSMVLNIVELLNVLKIVRLSGIWYVGLIIIKFNHLYSITNLKSPVLFFTTTIGADHGLLDPRTIHFFRRSFTCASTHSSKCIGICPMTCWPMVRTHKTSVQTTTQKVLKFLKFLRSTQSIWHNLLIILILKN